MMPRLYSPSHRSLGGLAAIAILVGSTSPAYAGAATGAATEWTQLANNAQLIDLLKSSGIQVDNQLTQIGQLAEQIQNQLTPVSGMTLPRAAVEAIAESQDMSGVAQ